MVQQTEISQWEVPAFPFEIDFLHESVKTLKKSKKNAHTLYSISLKRDNLLKMSYIWGELELTYCSLKNS